MSHLRLLPRPGEVIDEQARPTVHPDIAERMHTARRAGSIEAALHLWGSRVRASRGADVAWRTTRPPWPNIGRLYNRRSPVWLPTAEEERERPVAPLQLAWLFERAA